MQYSILKTIIETTIAQYICQSCTGRIDENSLGVQAISDNTIHMEVSCPHCQSHAHINAEVANMTFDHSNTLEPNTLIKNIIQRNTHAIKDEDIRTIEENLQNSQSIEDLLR